MAINTLIPEPLQSPRKDVSRAKRVIQQALFESTYDVVGNMAGPFMDPRDMFNDTDSGWGGYPSLMPPYYRQSQKRGEVLPVYLTETQLRLIRDQTRKLAVDNEFAICGMDNRVNYTVGSSGFKFKAVPYRKNCPPKLLDMVQRVIDGWNEHNDIPEYTQDMVWRLDRDGDCATRFFKQDSGLVILRTVEAEHIHSPAGDTYSPATSFGIQTLATDVETTEGYWVVENPLYNPMPSYVPAEEMNFIKINTPRSAKRGLPTFYPCQQLLRIAEDLLIGVAKNANHRAKIAMVRKMHGVLKEAAQTMMDELNDVTINDPSTGKTVNVENFRWGTILNATDNIDYDFPNAAFESTNFEIALQMVLRAACARLNMPEWMLTANAANANYSSSMISEAPSTKAFERLQAMMLRRVGSNRKKGRESLAWTQVKHAVEVGLLPPETLQLVTIQATGPSLVVRDTSGEAVTNRTYFEMRIKNRQTIQAELGLDPDEQEAGFKKDEKEAMEQQQEQLAQNQAQNGGQQPGQEGEQQPDMNSNGGGSNNKPNGNDELPDDGQARVFDSEGKNGAPPAGRMPTVEGYVRQANKMLAGKASRNERTTLARSVVATNLLLEGRMYSMDSDYKDKGREAGLLVFGDSPEGQRKYQDIKKKMKLKLMEKV